MHEVFKKFLNLLTVILAICFWVAACSSTTSTKFTESEMQLIPPGSFPKAFSPGERFIVKTKDYKSLMKVIGYEGNEFMIGLDNDQQKKVRIAINEIKEIEIIETKRPQYKSSYSSWEFPTAEEIVCNLPYLLVTPMLVTTPVLYPIYKSREKSNEIEIYKAHLTRLMYENISQDDLLTFLGVPKQKYLCRPNYRENCLYEVWEYDSKKVLPGGEFIFFSFGSHTTYFSRETLQYETMDGTPFSFYNCSSFTQNSNPVGYLEPNELYALASCGDNESAVYFLRLAGERGHLDAQKKLAIMYEYGRRNVPLNYDEAIKWYSKAAYQGDLDSQRKLGLCYIKSDKDYINAYAWLTIAANQGSNMSKKKRNEIANMMTPEQISGAEELIKKIKAN